MDIKDKVIVITGGAQGLGLAMAKEFAAKGAKLALVDLNEEPMAGARVIKVEDRKSGVEGKSV